MAPIKAGAKIRNARQPAIRGTFGCLVHARNDPHTLYILSAAHVIGLSGYALAGDAIEAEDPPGSERWTRIGEFTRATRLVDAAGAVQACDAALARVTDATRVSAEIDGIGWPGRIATGLFPGMPLQFRGAGTGQAGHATVHSTGAGVMAIYRDLHSGALFELEYADQILYVTDFDSNWSSPTAPMDSGALVLTEDGLPVGLHFSRTTDDFPIQAAICTPIATVLDALQVDLVVPGQHPLVPPALVAASAARSAAPLPSADDVGVNAFRAYDILLRSRLEPHNLFNGVKWQLSADGLIVDGKLDRTTGAMVTVPRVWRQFKDEILDAARTHRVPVELIMATICTESSGNPRALRKEPKWTSDVATPGAVSAGLMQTLLSTAREALNEQTIDREALFDPALSINAGSAYIGARRQQTHFDPPLVACQYNAGSIRINNGSANRWRMHQYPKGTGEHADRFTMWFNDSFAFLRENRTELPGAVCSFVQLLRG